MLGVCVCGKKFGKDIAGVSGCFHSPNLHMSLKVVLADSMMADVDASTMFVHRGACGDVFRGLVVREEVSRCVFIAIEFQDCLNKLACCMAS